MRLKDKLTVVSVALGVSLISFITAVVSGFFNGLYLLLNVFSVQSLFYIVMSLLGAAFALTYFFVKKRKATVTWIMFGVIAAAYLIAFIIVFAADKSHSAILLGYPLAETVSAAIVAVSYHLQIKLGSAEEKAETDSDADKL